MTEADLSFALTEREFWLAFVGAVAVMVAAVVWPGRTNRGQ